jgi:hypothetical protein
MGSERKTLKDIAENLNKREKAIIRIQSWYRCRILRKKYLKKKKSGLLIKKILRIHVA